LDDTLPLSMEAGVSAPTPLTVAPDESRREFGTGVDDCVSS
jgi:hypothetical protein